MESKSTHTSPIPYRRYRGGLDQQSQSQKLHSQFFQNDGKSGQNVQPDFSQSKVQLTYENSRQHTDLQSFQNRLNSNSKEVNVLLNNSSLVSFLDTVRKHLEVNTDNVNSAKTIANFLMGKFGPNDSFPPFVYSIPNIKPEQRKALIELLKINRFGVLSENPHKTIAKLILLSEYLNAKIKTEADTEMKEKTIHALETLINMVNPLADFELASFFAENDARENARNASGESAIANDDNVAESITDVLMRKDENQEQKITVQTSIEHLLSMARNNSHYDLGAALLEIGCTVNSEKNTVVKNAGEIMKVFFNEPVNGRR